MRAYAYSIYRTHGIFSRYNVFVNAFHYILLVACFLSVNGSHFVRAAEAAAAAAGLDRRGRGDLLHVLDDEGERRRSEEFVVVSRAEGIVRKRKSFDYCFFGREVKKGRLNDRTLFNESGDFNARRICRLGSQTRHS